MSVRVIVNPFAGGLRSLAPAARVRLAEQALARHRMAGRVEVTRAAGHGTGLARQAVADRCELVVAWGGDGTINEIASELVGTGTPLGIVRAGSGNGLARTLGIPADPIRALDIALTGRERPVDAGEIEGHRFFNVAGIGFDAAMAVEFNRLGGERRGVARYAGVVARALFTYPGARYAVEADERRIGTDALMIALANLAQYGSNVVIAPGARPDDGLLDVMVIGGRGAAGRIALVARAFTRTIDRASGVIRLHARRVVIQADSPILFHTDGEPHQGGPTVEAHMIPAAIHVRVK